MIVFVALFLISGGCFIFGLNFLKKEIRNTEFVDGFICASCIFAGAPFIKIVYKIFETLFTGGAS